MSRWGSVVGGLAILLVVSMAVTQPPRGLGFGGPAPQGLLGLLGMPEVRKEIATADGQNKQLDELIAEHQEHLCAAFGNFDFRQLQDLSEEERRKRFDEARKKAEEVTRKSDEKLGKILDAKQLGRLNELRLQREGASALQRPDIVKQLGLTAEQQEKLRKLLEQGFGAFPRGPQERERLQADALAVLTREQKTKWEELKGKEFRIPQAPGGFRPGGFGGPMAQERKVVKQFDKDGDGRLNAEERKAAREFLKKERAAGGRGPGGFGPRGPGGPGGPGGFGPPPVGQIIPAPQQEDLNLTAEQKKQLEALQKEAEGKLDKILTEEQRRQLRQMRGGGFGAGRPTREPAKPGPRISPADVKSYSEAGLYEPTVLRTLFLEFENKDWEEELADFKGTDVEVPATLIVDGKKYRDVGVHFRGMSSYGMTPAGYKRSLNLSLDFVHANQRLYGHKTLNLLNGGNDPSLLSTVLFSHISRKYVPAPKANFVKVAINGESWGIYTNAQQFNKEFAAENYKSKGARWKVRGSPGGSGGLEYFGENVEEYKRRFQLKSNEDDKAWKDLIALCRTLNKTPPDQLEAALKPILDIDGVLWFLALDVALLNEDGYWIRASDYSLFQDKKGKFHVIASDMNEAFQPAMGFGFGNPGAGPRGSGVEIDPLVGLNDARKPLRSKLLAVPALRERYLRHVRTIAEEWLDWKKLGPIVQQYRSLIEKELEADTRKLVALDSFQRATGDVAEGPGRGPRPSLRAFAEQRRKYLLDHTAVKQARP